MTENIPAQKYADLTEKTFMHLFDRLGTPRDVEGGSRKITGQAAVTACLSLNSDCNTTKERLVAILARVTHFDVN